MGPLAWGRAGTIGVGSRVRIKAGAWLTEQKEEETMNLTIVLTFVSLVIAAGLAIYGKVASDKMAQWSGAGVLALAALFLTMSMVRIVGPGHVGVQVLFGNVWEDSLSEGLHLTNPFLVIEQMSIRTEEYTMTSREGEGAIKDDDAIHVLSKDGLSIAMELTVLYHLDGSEASRVYRDIGPDYVDKIIRPSIRTVIRESGRKFVAIEAYAEKRDELSSEIATGLVVAFEGRGVGLETVLLRNIKLPPRIEEAIEAKLEAEQEAQRMVFVLEVEGLEAERKVIEADGIKGAQEIIAESLTSEYLTWYYIEAMKSLVDSPNNTILILPFDQGLIPMLQVPGS